MRGRLEKDKNRKWKTKKGHTGGRNLQKGRKTIKLKPQTMTDTDPQIASNGCRRGPPGIQSAVLLLLSRLEP